MTKIQIAAVLGSLAASVSAHGIVQGIVAGGKWYSGYNPSFQYADPPPTVIGWSTPEDQDLGFVAPDAYSDPDIICHKGATPGGASAKVAAGSVVELQWTVWPDSHHGPVIDYLAKCSGSCTNADKTSLEFFKIDQGGLIDGSTPPGTWASDQLIANNNSWVVTIPKSIAPGNYVLRHEIIALHSAGNEDGAQNYPQCINLQITGSGSDSPSGTLGTALYKADDPGILINIYTELSTYKIPGPSLIAGAVSMKQTTIPFNGAGTVSTAAGGSSASAPAASASATAASSSAAVASSAAGSYSVPAASSSVAGAASGSSSYVAPSSAAASSAPSYPAPSASSSVAGAASGSASLPAPSSVAPVSSGAGTVTCTTVITITGKPSSSSAVAPVSSSIVASISSSSSIPAPPLPSASYGGASTVVAVPSGGAPSGAPPAPTGGHPGPGRYPPNKPIPKGFTFGDLLAWLKYTIRTVINKGGKKHARDFTVR
jgi:hypothetical protein